MREGKGKGCGCGHWQKLRMGVGFCREKAEEEIPSPEPKLSYAQPRKKKVAIIIEGPGKHEERERERERGAVLGKAYGKIREMFEMKEELGRGRFGVTYRCMEKTTGREYACKSIAKKRSNGENVRREVMILQHVSGQDKIVELKGAYEDANNVHLVMELCTGGELFHRILSRGRGAHSEPEAASIISQILSALHACHVMGVIHRDIKPENFLFTTSHPDSPLKLTDFGSSLFFHKHQLYTDFVANAYYLPPEVFKRSYGKEIDIWNAGVILYILLTGFPPFSAGTAYCLHPFLLRFTSDLP
ncbi:hypothetical protein VNO78_28586 [Psophocarpus tetragonolobus]|uniref:Protein kinase domain-containing protein n=1 Tax=Psophocarpus tetragonolobus TaxID=3891 RepID=A0AAN9RTG0_PSOTE